MARYMEGPYTEEDKQMIRNLIKKEVSAPEGWPKFEVVCVGRARTHAEGIKRVRELRSKEYAFTTDAENDGEAKAAATLQHYKDINSNHVLTKNEITSNLLAKSNLPTDSESEKSDDVDDKE
ncbi:hypothetical protein PV326_011775, partial [Microctonus aethiopoides]